MRAFLAASLAVALISLGCGSSEKSPSSTGGSGGSETGGSVGATTGGSGGGGGGTGGGVATGGTGGSGGAIPDAASTGGSGGEAGAPDAGASADSWESYAKGFFASFCVACHNDDNKGVATRDYHQLANVMKEKAKIACGLSPNQAAWTQRGCTGSPGPGQFPVGSGAKPSDAERERLIRWLDAGTP